MNFPHLVQAKRVYDPPQPADGARILVDRLWPRGLSKKKANVNEWMKGIAPSSELRHWFAHIPERFPVFSALYERELLEDPVHLELVLRLKKYREAAPLTLLYGAKNNRYNHAQVLLRVLEQICGTTEHIQ